MFTNNPHRQALTQSKFNFFKAFEVLILFYSQPRQHKHSTTNKN